VENTLPVYYKYFHSSVIVVNGDIVCPATLAEEINILHTQFAQPQIFSRAGAKTF